MPPQKYVVIHRSNFLGNFFYSPLTSKIGPFKHIDEAQESLEQYIAETPASWGNTFAIKEIQYGLVVGGFKVHVDKEGTITTSNLNPLRDE